MYIWFFFIAKPCWVCVQFQCVYISDYGVVANGYPKPKT